MALSEHIMLVKATWLKPEPSCLLIAARYGQLNSAMDLDAS